MWDDLSAEDRRAVLEAERRAAARNSNGHRPRPEPPLCLPPAYRPFPAEALPPLARDYVLASALAIGCDPALVALPCLGVLAGCVGNSRALVLKRGWREPSVVWAVTVAPSGAQKSPAFAAAVDPLLAVQCDALDADPEAHYHVTTDATVWALGELLRDNPRGVLLARDELDGWFQGFTRHSGQGSTDRPHWLELHRAGTLRVDRITRERGPLTVRRACCSVCGTIQPTVLARALDDEALAAGLGARFLLAMPPRRRRRWTEAEVGEGTASAYRGLLHRLLALEPDGRPGSNHPHWLGLTPAAKAMWVEWYDRWAGRQYEATGEEAAALAKLEGYAGRLALLHHVVACAAVESDSARHSVGEASVRAGCLLAEWFADEALRVYAVLREGERQREARELAEWVAARGRVRPRDVQHNLRRRYPTVEEAELALNALVESGLGRWEEEPSGPSGGRPTHVFVLGGADTTPRNPGNSEVVSARPGAVEEEGA